MTITTAQIRGARGILNWSQSDLAEQTGISTTSIGAIENGHTKARESTVRKMQSVFEIAGIEFLGTDGVRIKSSKVRTFKGRPGFVEFFDYVYDTLSFQGGDVYVINVDEAEFMYWGGETAQPHLERMAKLKNVKYHVLVKEGDTKFKASAYADYKWIPKNEFISVPFYVFGDNLAIILLEPEPDIILLQYPAIAEAYRRQFMKYWNTEALNVVS